MKTIILLLAIMVVYGCSDRIRAYADYDPEFPDNDYSTFGWAKKRMLEPGKDSLYNTGANETKIRLAVQKQLEVRGYTLTTELPDFKVYYHITVNDQSMIAPEPLGYNYGPYWMQLGANSYPYGAGTLIVDVLDTKTNNLTWRGWAVAPVDDTRTPEEIDDLFKTILEKIFRKFPNTPKHTFVKDDKI